ncbi:MAG: TetR/AcrR family transcriptional regulator [Silvibacterium sp.]
MRRGKRRPIAGREEILAAARDLSARNGWRAVTIRSVAQELGYTSPLLYEHFHDKEDLLTQIAVDALGRLEARLAEKLPTDHRAAVVCMVERYWTFMLEHTQLYRLVNGMDGVPIDKTVVGAAAQSLCKLVAEAVRPLLGENTGEADGQTLADELWALLHGMSALYMDRVAPFDLARVINTVSTLIEGARMREDAHPRRSSIR